MKKVNVAIIGAGIGQKHYNAYLQLPDLFNIKAICDTNAARAEAFVKPESKTRVTGSFDEILADPEVELVDICLPPHLHYSFTAKALRAGKDVICEKPLSNSVADVDSLIEIANETGQSVYPVFQYRFGNGIARLRALIESGLAGRPFVASMETHWNRDAVYYSVDWRGTWKGEQGGAILGHAIHMHDLLSFILGSVDNVYAKVDTRVNDIEVEDCAALAIQMTSGALATSSVTLGGASNTTRLRFCFEGLTAESGSNPYAPAEGDWTFTARAPVTQEQVDAVIAATPEQEGGQVGFSRQVYNAMRGLESEFVNIQEARRSIEFVSAVYQSARSGLPVSLPMQDGDPTYKGWMPS